MNSREKEGKQNWKIMENNEKHWTNREKERKNILKKMKKKQKEWKNTEKQWEIEKNEKNP